MVIEGAIAISGIVAFALWWRSRSPKSEEPIEPVDATVVVPEPVKIPEPAPKNSPQAVALERVLGRYKLGAYLGEGGMAQVYRATKTTGEAENFAVKLIKEEFTKDEEFQKRFHREISVCKDLAHPNIVRLVDWGEEEGALYLVMECIEGRELGDLIAEGPHKIGDVSTCIEGLISGLAYAHDRGVVHRDLKPSNIMLNESGEVKIMDFGLARTGDGDKVTKTGDSIGTPAYLPPEQITGAVPDPKADQYALGVILYEMLTGRRPFIEKNPLKMMMLHLKETPPDPSTFNSNLHPTSAAVLLKMLEKSPEKRFASVSTIGDAFKALARGEEWEMSAEAPLVVEGESPEVQILLTEEPTDDGDTLDFQVSSL